MFEAFDEQAAMKRMLKRALVRVCMDHERAAAMNKFDFLSY